MNKEALSNYLHNMGNRILGFAVGVIVFCDYLEFWQRVVLNMIVLYFLVFGTERFKLPYKKII